MNKKSILYILLDLVFLAVFNTVFFVVGGTNSRFLHYGTCNAISCSEK